MRKNIIPYLLTLLIITITLGLLIFYNKIDFKKPIVEILAYCSLFGMLGSIFYCLRAYYLHTAVFKDWDSDWNVWYYIRPIAGGISGFISLFFIKLGFLIFSSDQKVFTEGRKVLAYFTIAFIAGYKVKRFSEIIEGISKRIGIHRTS